MAQRPPDPSGPQAAVRSDSGDEGNDGNCTSSAAVFAADEKQLVARCRSPADRESSGLPDRAPNVASRGRLAINRSDVLSHAAVRKLSLAACRRPDATERARI
jgi:hypothetical protein